MCISNHSCLIIVRLRKTTLNITPCLCVPRYGSYEMSYDPDFRAVHLSLLDRGWVVAIAHVRGGGDMGRLWYEDGKYLHKKNSFHDFIACADHLIKVRGGIVWQGSV